MNWLREGNRNSKIFHAAIKARRIHNSVRLKLKDGSHTDDRDVIGNKAEQYFKALFSSFPVTKDIDVSDLISPTISDADNLALAAQPSEHETRDAVFSMNPNSSPGPDGFTGKFFTGYWDIIKEDLLAVVAAFFNGLQLPKIISSANIVLIPKVPKATSMDQLRPISLCNVLHKIMSKILNNRLKSVLGSIISPEQAGFLEGRNIQDSIAMAHDLVRDINHKIYGGNVLIKLDMSKAYDRLSWSFLLKMMRAFGFSKVWCDLIYRNISNCWYSVIWEGSPFGFFKSNRGVRQGDPLSPSLFILSMEYFSRLINHSIIHRKVIPYQVKGTCTNIQHLLYADDLLIFSSGMKISISKLLGLIEAFCNLSGQQLSHAKSSIFFSKHINHDRKVELLRLTQFREGTFPTLYLGVPLFPGRAHVSYFQHLEDKIKGKISGWAKQFLSFTGRATLIMSVLASMSIYTMSILPVPKTCLRNIERLLSNFLWDSGASSRRHWLSWDLICTPRQEGGLGLKMLSDIRKAVLAKLAWKFLLNDSAWASYARLRYKNKPKGSALWRAIFPLIQNIRQNSYWLFGNGSTKTCHYNEWVNAALPKEATRWSLKDVIINEEIRGKFTSCLPPNLNHILDDIQLSREPDRLLWRGSQTGEFTVKKAFLAFRTPLPKNRVFANLWQTWLPPKVSAIVWKLFRNIVPTDDNVAKVGFSLPSKCLCCESPQSETIDHLFFKSDVARKCWKFIGNLFDEGIPENKLDLAVGCFWKPDLNNFMNCLHLALACCCVWELTLDILHVRPNASGKDGFWRCWRPGEKELTLSMSFNARRCGVIVRSHTGTFKCGFKMNLDSDDLLEAFSTALALCSQHGFSVGSIQGLHPDLLFADAKIQDVPLDAFFQWRDIKKRLDQIHFVYIPPAVNGAAIALCYAVIPTGSYLYLKDLPKQVKVALVGDYLKLPS
ncbi:hypothetical protein QQ045_032033 [Rhodiola kirilowii]